MSARLFSVLLAILTVCVGCSQKQDKKPPPPPIKVGILTVDRGDLELALDVSGTLKFTANTILSAEVSAQVQSIEVSDGQFVQQDDLLLIFDETRIRETANQAQANLQKDEALLAYLKAEWEKNKVLHESGSISQIQYDQKFSAYQTAAAQVESNRAALAKAMEDLKKTKVKAPIQGVISRRFIEKGDWISSGGRLFQISDYNQIYLEAFLTDVDIGKLPMQKIRADGMDCRVTIDPYPGATFNGKLTYVQPVANDNRLFEIRVYLPNPDMNLLQGMVGRGRIVFKTIPDVLRVPLQALLEEIRNNTDNNVFMEDADKKAGLKRIKVGLCNQTYAEVLDGLQPGDKVVIQGKEILNSGQLLQSTVLDKPQG
jgi:membrane fusion protein (multidrug efflux system)